MAHHRLGSWFKSFRGRRRPIVRNQSRRTQLTVTRYEDRVVPSSSIPINSTTWTAIGPSPISFGQAPGSPSSSGRVNGIAVDPSNSNVMYVATDTGGIWATGDGGNTWSPRTDQLQLDFQSIAMVHRAGGNTIYAFDQQGNFYVSTDGATTFTVTATSPFEAGATVNKLIVVPTDPTDQTKDILYAAVGSIFGVPPSAFNPMTTATVLGSGIWRSTDGGQTWTDIVDPTMSPFTSNPTTPVPADSLSFSDLVVNPTNANIVYAAVGNANGDPTNGVYRTNNALATTPSWSLLIGGSAAVPGEVPGNISLAIAPNAPSEIFASLALRIDPQSGFQAPLLGVFRSTDSGANWSPVLLPTNPNNPTNDPNNFLGLYGYDNNVIAVAPNGSTNPLQQTVYLGGYGEDPITFATLPNTAMLSTNSGSTWTDIGVGSNGVGTYPNIHQAAFDTQGRLILATGGGVYRLDSNKPVTWESLNGTAGPGGLDIADFNGFELNPTDPNKALGNISDVGDQLNAATGIPVNVAPSLNNAVTFSDPGTGGASGAAYGWTTVDALNGIDDNFGDGQVVYNPFNPNIIYRVVPDDGSGNFIRVSIDGGQNWSPATNGFETDPFLGSPLPNQILVGLSQIEDGMTPIIPPLTIDPSQPNRLFSGFLNVQETENNGTGWGTSLQYGAGGATNPIPPMPTAAAGIPITAIGVGRDSGTANGEGFNGVTLFVGTTDDVLHDPTTPDDDPTATPAGIGPQVYVNLIPTNSAFPPAGDTWDDHSWANITPTDPTTGADLLTGNVEQIVVDPANNNTLYVFTSTGQVFRGSGFQFQYELDANNVIVGYQPDLGVDSASASWTDLTGNLPGGKFPSPITQGLALDPQVFNDPTDDVLYAATPASGVWKLTNPAADFSVNPPVWQEVGLDPNNANAPTIPIAPVTAISLDTSTGILGAATYGRGVYEIQIRGVISGTVFTDTNGNGVKDGGEPTLPNTTVELLDQNQGGTIVAATTTNASGFYQFLSVTPGDYTVVAVVGAGEIQTTGEPADLATFTEQSNDVVSLGYFKPGSISGTTFGDTNDNGIKDNGETGVGGFTVYIDSNNDGIFESGESSTVSTGNGSFSFANLGPAVIGGAPNPVTFNGQYIIREAPLAGWIQTTPPLSAISLTSGLAVTGQLIGDTQSASIAGTLFIDTNGDGVQQSGEVGAGGFTIQLSGPGGTQMTTTAADGSYSFPGLAAGTYTLTEPTPAGYTQTTANPAAITVGQVQHVTGFNFGVFQNVNISGETFNDANANGVLDSGEAAVGGFTIALENAATSAVITTAVSNPLGRFSFTNVGPLPGGANYAIVEEPRTGYVQTTTVPAAFAPTSGATNLTTFQFGTFQQYSVSGTAYIDTNDDGTQDNGETGGAGFVIDLLNSSNTVVGTATTVANGSYTISGIGPGAFAVIEEARNGYSITQGATGYSLSGQNDVNVTGKSFGNAQVASISGSAFVDTNGNGVLDAGEGGAAGFTIQLSGPGGTQTFVTATNGSFNFNNLAAGTYTVTELPLAGWTQTTANPAAITVAATDNITGVTFGDFKQVTLSGMAFKDANDDGVLDGGESGIAGITINLTNAATAQVLATTTTTATGVFSFANVGPLAGGADYAIREKVPAGAFQTTANPAAFAPASGTNDSTFQFGIAFEERTIVTGVDAGSTPTVTVRDAATGNVLSSFLAYASTYTGGVRVATGFFTGGTTPDIVTAAGPGGGPHVKLVTSTGATLASFYAYNPTFTGGVYVAVGDVNGDGVPDIITGADAGGGPQVKVFDGASLLKGEIKVLYSFYAYASTFTGGVRVAAADLDGDGFADIITGAGPGGGPHVEAFSGKTGATIRSYYAYNPMFTGGVFVAAGDVTGSGQQDIITGPGNGGPEVRVFDGATNGTVLNQTYAFPQVAAGTLLVWTSGLRVATTVDANGLADIIAAPGAGEQSYVRLLDGDTLDELTPPGQLTVFDPSFIGGIFVGGT